MIKIAICGVCGRMGKRIATLATYDTDIEIAGATEVKGCSLIGVNLGKELKNSEIGSAISDDLGQVIDACDCAIDFTSPDATMSNIEIARKHKKPIVIGTTGFTQEQLEKIKSISSEIPVLVSPNMSIGVNLVFDIVKKAADTLDNKYKVNIEEVHHIHKKDKPSGTAKHFADVIRNASKDHGDITIDSIREGEVVGNHKIVIDSEQDTIEIIHKAKTRDIFALGALQGAKFLVGKPNGLYTMKHVLEAL